MLSLEQIQRLENKVYKAVELIKALKEENSTLKSKLVSANEKSQELEQFIADLRNSQAEIEETVVKALKQLDEIEKLSGIQTEQLEQAEQEDNDRQIPGDISEEEIDDNVQEENSQLDIF